MKSSKKLQKSGLQISALPYVVKHFVLLFLHQQPSVRVARRRTSFALSHEFVSLDLFFFGILMSHVMRKTLEKELWAWWAGPVVSSCSRRSRVQPAATFFSKKKPAATLAIPVWECARDLNRPESESSVC